ncbi:MAG: hypothetical protein FWE30_04275, partial [Bacteroidales bacterium]|nr:hypothetical protein [Bacteroidales bacterium]
MRKLHYCLLVTAGLLFIGLPTYAQSAGDAPQWAIALHGGAGGASGSQTPERRAIYEAHLAEALNIGK